MGYQNGALAKLLDCQIEEAYFRAAAGNKVGEGELIHLLFIWETAFGKPHRRDTALPFI